ncbi:ABC transporter permease [Bacillus sp. T33-2]|uniref:ABC transporter permease n=1 Tax=Bacillus sp. T33-2 TaxID=2054168 RepID=UPI000C77CE3C|nr:peptide ABC transporter permease [Bacillus sp. T33-2]PLR99673.1 peptide ABC transporter permease [Bacillus sp. T33-2]
MRKWNWKLPVGMALAGLFVIIAIFGPYIAPYDVNMQMDIKYVKTENGEEMMAPPFPPSKEHIFGTDKWGYDILTLVLHGAKYTVFTVIFVAVLRVTVGCLFGMLMALNKSAIKSAKRKVKINIFSGFPIFIFIYFILIKINIDPVLKPLTLTVLLGSLMVILGLAGVYDTVNSKTNEIKNNLFVTASQSIGGTKAHIAMKHIFPALKSHLLIIFVNEIIQVLHLVGQLGIFDLFLGGTLVRIGPPTIYLSLTKEWAGLIGQARSFLYHSQWILIFPMLCFLVFLFAFYLISQGLNQQQKTMHRKIPYL